MIRNRIHAGRGGGEQVRGDGGFTDRAGRQNRRVGRGLLDEGIKVPEIPAIGARVIARRRTAHCGQVGLVHEFGGGDAASDRTGKADEAAGLLRRPVSGSIAAAGADRERGHDAGVDGSREIDHATPLRAGQDVVESRRRVGRRVV